MDGVYAENAGAIFGGCLDRTIPRNEELLLEMARACRKYIQQFRLNRAASMRSIKFRSPERSAEGAKSKGRDLRRFGLSRPSMASEALGLLPDDFAGCASYAQRER